MNEFETIINQYGGRIFGYLLRFLLNREDTEDILQNVFISFYHHMDEIDPQKYLPYLYRTARNQAINFQKKRKRYVSLPETELEDLPDNDDIEKNNSENNIKLQEAMHKLKEKEKLVLELQFYQNMGYKEIARLMRITPRAVDSLLVRAKRKLRKFLRDIG